MIFQEEPPRDFRQTSYQMQIDNEFTDVTLVTRDGKSIRAHKLILSAVSPVLKRMIMDQNINAIYMWDVSNSIMEYLIRYIYFGEVTVPEEEETHFFKIAQSLELTDEDLIDNGEKTSDTEEDQNSGNEEDMDTYTERVNEKTIDEVQYSGNEEDLDTDTERVNEKTCETEESENSVIDDDLDAETETVSEETRKAKEFQHSVKNKKKKFQCERCDKSFPQGQGLSRHVSTIHKNRKYQCDSCLYNATTSSHLNDHIQSIHQGIKFKCKHCDKSYKHRNALNDHMKKNHN